jgi:hypothetical protein
LFIAAFCSLTRCRHTDRPDACDHAEHAAQPEINRSGPQRFIRASSGRAFWLS